MKYIAVVLALVLTSTSLGQEPVIILAKDTLVKQYSVAVIEHVMWDTLVVRSAVVHFEWEEIGSIVLDSSYGLVGKDWMDFEEYAEGRGGTNFLTAEENVNEIRIRFREGVHSPDAAVYTMRMVRIYYDETSNHRIEWVNEDDMVRGVMQDDYTKKQLSYSSWAY